MASPHAENDMVPEMIDHRHLQMWKLVFFLSFPKLKCFLFLLICLPILLLFKKHKPHGFFSCDDNINVIQKKAEWNAVLKIDKRICS